MKMVADLSHWVCVAETDPSDPDLTAVIEKFAGQMLHTHCRWGQSSPSHDSVYIMFPCPGWVMTTAPRCLTPGLLTGCPTWR